jgi:hypothetical protein
MPGQAHLSTGLGKINLRNAYGCVLTQYYARHISVPENAMGFVAVWDRSPVALRPARETDAGLRQWGLNSERTHS